jgi:hypothetical protein
MDIEKEHCLGGVIVTAVRIRYWEPFADNAIRGEPIERQIAPTHNAIRAEDDALH